MKRTLIAFSIGFFFLSLAIGDEPKISSSVVTVRGNVIGTMWLVNQIDAHKGLAFTFAADSKEIWIYPKGGWRVVEGDLHLGDKRPDKINAIEKNWDGKNVIGDTANKVTGLFDVHVDDAGVVRYQRSGLFGPKPEAFNLVTRKRIHP